jgi:hypothetical protein
MKAIRLALGSFLFVAFFASGSMAQGVQRTFVSGLGNDGNPCTRTAPCRIFAQAILGTNAGGEVVVLDSAGYGPITIIKSVSITAPPGVYAGISVFSGDGIDINAGGSDAIILRGLTISNQGSSGNGIVFTAGGTLHVESCVVHGFSSGRGVSFNGAGNLEVKDSIIRGSGDAIYVQPSSGTAVAAIDQVRLELCGNGLVLLERSKGTVRNSVASGSGSGAGFYAISTTGAPVELNIENCVASNNSDGIHAQSTSTGVATVRISNSTLTDNMIGLHNFGSPAVLLSRGNNTVEGNGTDTSGTIGSYSAK